MAKEQLVKMIVRPYIQSGTKTWELEVVGTGKGGPGHYPEAKVKEKYGGNFQITIADADNVTFSNDPIWIQTGTAKPNHRVVDSQIDPSSIKGQNGKVLTFHDFNSGPKLTLTYQLNFSDGTTLDPIIQNGGGTIPKSIFGDYAVLLGAVLMGALVALVVRRFFFNSPAGLS